MDVVLLAVISLDGCLTKHDAIGAAGLASAADAEHFRSTLESCDASICGRMTYEGERERLLRNVRSGNATRRRIVMTRSPHLFVDDAVRGLLEFTDAAPQLILDDLRAEGRERVALLGGGEIYNQFLSANLVDELSLTVEMRIFGTGIRLAGSTTPIDPAFSLRSINQLGPNTVLLTLNRSAMDRE